MFDTVHHHKHETKTNFVTKENTVVEKSITPDKVTEMYDKVKGEISSAYLPKGNTFELVVLSLQSNPNNFGKEIFISYKLNGTQNDMRIELKNGFEKDKVFVLDEIRKDVAKNLTDMLMTEIFRKNFF